MLAAPGILADIVGGIFFQFVFSLGIIVGLYTQSWIIFGASIFSAMAVLLIISTLWSLKKAVNF